MSPKFISQRNTLATFQPELDGRLEKEEPQIHIYLFHLVCKVYILYCHVAKLLEQSQNFKKLLDESLLHAVDGGLRN